mmetsp:Transcript_6234/g.15161  ORF Transcript_6234/g.15161 Transcript_6234/m.15161 type:complete len:202 (-) Transcript_6234:531-1136(-)
MPVAHSGCLAYPAPIVVVNHPLCRISECLQNHGLNRGFCRGDCGIPRRLVSIRIQKAIRQSRNHGQPEAHVVDGIGIVQCSSQGVYDTGTRHCRSQEIRLGCPREGFVDWIHGELEFRANVPKRIQEGSGGGNRAKCLRDLGFPSFLVVKKIGFRIQHGKGGGLVEIKEIAVQAATGFQIRCALRTEEASRSCHGRRVLLY